MCHMRTVTDVISGRNQMLIVHYRRWSVYTFRIYQLHGKAWQGKLFILLIISTEYCIISVYPFGDIYFDGNVCIIHLNQFRINTVPQCRLYKLYYLNGALTDGNNLRLNGQQRSPLWVWHFQALLRLFMAERWKDWCPDICDSIAIILQSKALSVLHVKFIT